VDAATERTYSYIRRNGIFSKVLESTKKIRKISKSNSHPQISWWFVVMKHNYNEIIPFIELAIKHKVNSVALSLINYQRPRFYLENPLYDRSKARELLAIAKKADKLALREGIGLLDRIGPSVFIKYPDLGPKELNLTDKKSISKFGKIHCDFFWTTLKVERGSVWACPWVKKKYRNIPFEHKKQNLQSMWNTELLQEARKKMLMGEYDSVCGSYCPIYLKWKMGHG
jgi:MoaA/NifB/PqqE/SkfB family radical SAM enzyme